MLPSAQQVDSDPQPKQSFRSLTNLQLAPHFVDPSNPIQGPLNLCTDDYNFSLVNLDSECFIEDARVSFKPQINSENNQYHKIIPCYNLDHHYWTPAFILEKQKNNIQSWKKKFEQKLEQADSQFLQPSSNNPIKMPIKKDSVHCRVCKQKIFNFQKHIKQKSHIININQSIGQKFILKLVKKYKKQMKKLKKSKKIANLKSNESCKIKLQHISQDQLQYGIKNKTNEINSNQDKVKSKKQFEYQY